MDNQGEFSYLVVNYFSVGNTVQNILFYGLITLLLFANLYLVKGNKKGLRKMEIDKEDDLPIERPLIQTTAEFQLLLKEKIELIAEIHSLKTDLFNIGEELERSYVKSDKLNDQLTDILDCLDLNIEYDENSWNWHIDINNNELFLSEYGLRISGFSHYPKMTWMEWMVVVDDQYREAFETALTYSLTTGADFSMKFKINPIDGGKKKWIRSWGSVVYSDQGIPLKIAGRFTFTFGESTIV